MVVVAHNHTCILVGQHKEKVDFTQCLKITQKVSFCNIASEASYVYLFLARTFKYLRNKSNIRKIHQVWILVTFDVKIDIFPVIFRYFFELFRMYFYSSKDSSESRLCSPKFPRDSKMPTRAHDHLIWRPLCFLRMLQNSLNCFIRLIWWAMSTNICSCVG